MGSWLDELLGISVPAEPASAQMIPRTRMPVQTRGPGVAVGMPGVKLKDQAPATVLSQDWNFLDWVNGGSGFPSAGVGSANAYPGISDSWAHALLRAHGYGAQASATNISDLLGIPRAPSISSLFRSQPAYQPQAADLALGNASAVPNTVPNYSVGSIPGFSTLGSSSELSVPGLFNAVGVPASMPLSVTSHPVAAKLDYAGLQAESNQLTSQMKNMQDAQARGEGSGFPASKLARLKQVNAQLSRLHGISSGVARVPVGQGGGAFPDRRLGSSGIDYKEIYNRAFDHQSVLDAIARGQTTVLNRLGAEVNISLPSRMYERAYGRPLTGFGQRTDDQLATDAYSANGKYVVPHAGMRPDAGLKGSQMVFQGLQRGVGAPVSAAADLLGGFGQWITGQPASARPVEPVTRAQWDRRNEAVGTSALNTAPILTGLLSGLPISAATEILPSATTDLMSYLGIAGASSDPLDAITNASTAGAGHALFGALARPVSRQVSNVLESVAKRHLAQQALERALGVANEAATAEPGVQFRKPGTLLPAESSQGVPALFTTESGHVYDLHDGGLTNRYVHNGDRYFQLPRSSSTFYLSPEDATVLAGQVQGSGQTVATFLDPESGSQKAGVKYLNGPLEGQFHPGSIVDALSEPQRGLVPVETFGQGASPAFGDRIAGIDYTSPESLLSQGAETYGPNLEYSQYRLEAKKLGMYPVMTRGFKDPTDWVRLDAGDHWKYGQTKRGELRYDPRFLDDLNLKFVGETYHDTRLGAREAEYIRILHQRSRTGGELLPGNKIHG